MSKRPIVLPKLPADVATAQCGRWADDAPGLRADCAEKIANGRRCYRCPDTEREKMEAYAREAVEVDRASIEVTEEDWKAARKEFEQSDSIYEVLESFARRLRGD